MQLHPVEAPTRAQNSPKTRPGARFSPSFLPLFFPPRLAFAPFKPFSRPFSLSSPNCPPRPVETPTHEKKRPKAAPSPPLPALNSTQFNPASFKIRPRLNASLNRIKPKLNPIQPFAHFVLSSVLPPHSRNSLIYTPFPLFRFIGSLYISFSCP